MEKVLVTRTEQELNDLKRSWKNDPCWDIEDTEGFEAHYSELVNFKIEAIQAWQDEWKQKCLSKACEAGIPGNFQFGQYLVRQEQNLDRLWLKVAKLHGHDEID